MENLNLKQNNEIVWDEKKFEIIGKLIGKYELEKEVEEEIKKILGEAKNFLQKEGIKLMYSKKIDNQLKEGKNIDDILASRKLIKIIEELNKNKISSEKIAIILRGSFNLSQKDAEKLNKDIQENLPLLIEKSHIIEENKQEEKVPPITKTPLKDAYKEPIE